MSTAVATKAASPVAVFSKFMEGFKSQMALALPKHLNVERMTRLTLTQFSMNEKLQQCTPHSIAGSVMVASTLGLEPGVNGQGYLVPYWDNRKKSYLCQFIPGWKGLVDIANRSGRCTVWTGAVFEGDEFSYGLGDRPFVDHKPGDEDNPDKLLFVYAIGRAKGSEWPVIEVWSMKKIWKHRDAFNKVGESHYSYRNPEMYARKVPLLQVLKYMPSSVELSNAIEANNAVESARNITLHGDFLTIDPEDERDQDERPVTTSTGQAQTSTPAAKEQPTPFQWTEEAFAASLVLWKKAIGKKTAENLIATAASKGALSKEQEQRIRDLYPKTTTELETAADKANPATGEIVFTEEDVAKKIADAKDMDQLALAGSLIASLTDPKARNRQNVNYDNRSDELAAQE